VIGLCFSDANERLAALARFGGEKRVTMCANGSQLTQLARSGRLTGVVTDLACWFSDGFGELRELVTRSTAQIPLCVAFDLCPASARQIVALADAALDLRLVLRGFDDVMLSISEMLEGDPAQRPERAVIRLFTERSSTATVPILLGAALIGRRRSDVRRLATLSGSSVRTLNRRLETEALPTARVLLGWSLALYASWRMEVFGWSAKRAADGAGFRDVDVFATFVKRNTGTRPAGMLSQGGFSASVERCRQALRLVSGQDVCGNSSSSVH
jgi:hypothetical protein